jgi:isopenicillin N synthase-like dioxygenase
LIPRVDLDAPKDVIVNKILEASRSGGPGFLYVINHGIDQSIFENAISESNKFYSQPLDQKLDISFKGYAGSPLNKSSKGYTYPGFEGSYAKDGASDVRPKTEDASVQKNSREALVFRYPELKENDRAYLQDYTTFRNNLNGSVDMMEEDINIIGSAAKCFFASNQWPKEDDLPTFRPSIEAYFNQMNRLATNMFDLFLHALRTELNVSEDHHFYHYDTPMSTFNLAHYPPSEMKGLGISDHTDWELFTLLYPNFCPIKNDIAYTGLEIWHHGGWVKVPHIPGAIIVNQGEMLSRFSQGKFRPPVHRVDARHKRDRYSLVSFWAPNYDTILPDPNVNSKKVISGEYYLKRNNMI